MIEYFLTAFFVANQPVPAAAPSPGSAPAEPKSAAPTTFRDPVNITADRLEIFGKRQQAVYSGRVKVRRGNTTLSCDRLVAYFTNTQQISRLECVGGVEVVDGDRWARGERAEFDNVAGVLEVTGSPEAAQGPNKMRGTKVLFFLGRDLLQVENATTIIDTSRGGLPNLPGGKPPAQKPAQPAPKAK